MKEQINVNGKRLNKLEEIVRLLQKLNEEMFSKEQLEAHGYRIRIELKADGSGSVFQRDYPELLFTFGCTAELEDFLKADRLSQLNMATSSVYNRIVAVKEKN